MFTIKRKLILSGILVYLILFTAVKVLSAEPYKPVHKVDSTFEYISLQALDAKHEIIIPKIPDPIFKHGDISWLPELAAEAGWPPETWRKLGQIILRESGGCPIRFGGSIVDKNCKIVGHDGSDHRSDSGLLQINGVHWKKDHPQYAGLVCKKMKICTQEPLFDAVTNLRAGKLIYDVTSNWAPWDPCYWGPKFANRCAAAGK